MAQAQLNNSTHPVAIAIHGGAGTYADNRVCAISATGHGEFFIRAAVAHDICSRARYLKIPLAAAAEEVIHRDLVKMGASGGVITLDPGGTDQ